MTIDDLKTMYDEKQAEYGSNAYKHMSELLSEAKAQHRRDWLQNPTSGRDHDQSWRAFKGKNLEKLIEYMIQREVEGLGLTIVNGNSLERARSGNLSRELSLVKRNLLVDFGELGCHLPDVDIVIYKPETSDVVAVLSSKVTLRERVAQTGYWKLKLSADEVTEHIKVYFITLDEDGTLTSRDPAKKGRAIVEVDTDGGYVMTVANLEESDKIRLFEHFMGDLREILNDDAQT